MPVPQFSKAVNSSRLWHGHRCSRVCESFPGWLWDTASHSVYCNSAIAKTPNTCGKISWWSPKLTLQDPNCLGGRVYMRWKNAGILLSLPFLIPNVTTIAVRKTWATKAPRLSASLLNWDNTHAAHLTFADKKVLSVHGHLCMSCGLGFESATERYKASPCRSLNSDKITSRINWNYNKSVWEQWSLHTAAL